MHDVSFLITAVIALAAAGVLAGFVSGLLGVGGGIITVPVMFEIFGLLGVDPDVKMHLAVGTSLATIIPTSIMSAWSHAKRGAVDKTLLKILGPWGFIGVLIGAAVAGPVKGDVLMGVFATVAAVVSLYMFFRRDHWRLGHEIPQGFGGGVFGAVIGFLSTLMGIGGGTLGVPTMTLFNVPIHRAVGTASAFGLIVSLPGAIGFVVTGWNDPTLPPLSLGYVSILASGLLLPSILLIVPYGAKVAHSLSRGALQRAFGTFLALVSARMLTSLFF